MVLTSPEDAGSSNSEVHQNTVDVNPPKRILHFSDGVLEEYSDDETGDDDAPNNEETKLVNPAELAWGPWLWYKTWRAGKVTLSAVDTAGEALASFFGITTPKYYFEIEEYKRREEMKKNEEEQAKGWSQAGDSTTIHLNQMTTKQPKPEEV